MYKVREIFKKSVQKVWVLFFAVCLSACGGDDTGGELTLEPRPNGSVSGVAFDGLIMGGEVSVYEWQGGTQGDALSDTVITNSLGEYELILEEVPSQPVLLEITGGRYIEEASALSVPLKLSDRLYAVIDYTQGQSIKVSITYYTTLATGYAEYLVRTGTSEKDAIQIANDLFSSQLGFDILSVVPVDITNSINATPSVTDSHLYGFATASISQLTKWISEQNNKDVHFIYSSINFAQDAYDDIRYDGKLDGQGIDGIIAQGVIPLNEDIYRNSIALNMLVMANDSKNTTEIEPKDIIQLVNKFNEFNAGIFGEEPIVPLNQSVPSLSNFSHKDNQLVSGTIDFSFDATDITGISSIKLLINDELYQVANNFEDLSFTIDTTAFSDASHTFTVVAKNFAGGEASIEIPLTIANQDITISNLSPKEGSYIRGIHDFSALVTDSFGVQSTHFMINEVIKYSPDSFTEPVISLDTAGLDNAGVGGLEDGEHTFTVNATNANNFSTSKTTTFIVDNTKPEIIWGLEDNSYLSGKYYLNANISDAIEIKSATLFLNGEVLEVFSSFPDIEYTLDTTLYPEGIKNLVIQSEDMAGNLIEENRTVTFDNNKPTVSIISPFPGEVITSSFNVRASVYDSMGIEEVAIFIDDVFYTLSTRDEISAAEINIFSFDEGAHDIKVIVTDISGKTSTAEVLKVEFRHKKPTANFLGYTFINYDDGELGGRNRYTEYTYEIADTESISELSIQSYNSPWVPRHKKSFDGNSVKISLLEQCHQFLQSTGRVEFGSFVFNVKDEVGLSESIDIRAVLHKGCSEPDDYI